MVRDVSIELFNQHNKLELSQKIIANLQRRFAEVLKVADTTETDATTLDEISTQRKIKNISVLCAVLVATVEEQQSSTYLDAIQFESNILPLLKDLQTLTVPTEDLNQVRDEIALTLLHCFNNIVSKKGTWNECSEILTLASKHAGSYEIKNQINRYILFAGMNGDSETSDEDTKTFGNNIKTMVRRISKVLVIIFIWSVVLSALLTLIN